MQAQPSAEARAAPPLRDVIDNALCYWELRRIPYNLVLTAVVLAWVVMSWPHFRPAVTLQSLLLLSVLAMLANVCYCAAYLVDLPLQYSSFRGRWLRWRAALWVAGMLFATLLANYWIADEIYPAP
jgi:hypothetical protein